MATIPRPVGLTIKRLADLLISATFLILSAPLMLICAVVIKFDSAGPVFFVQERLGIHGKLFRVYKFRTMVQDAEEKGSLASVDDPRITRVGSTFRRFRVDEWPQLINVFLGEMSLVGPRPLVPLHAASWTEEERRRLDMKPGMTGWQQINGAATNTWEERVALDLWYVGHWSLWLDLKIFLRTPLVVLGAKTVYGSDGVERSAIPTRVLGDGNGKQKIASQLSADSRAESSSQESAR